MSNSSIDNCSARIFSARFIFCRAAIRIDFSIFSVFETELTKVFRRWAKADLTSLKKASLLDWTIGEVRRVSSTTAEATLGEGRKAAAGTLKRREQEA